MALHLTGVLLINLGTPDGCDVASVRRYLKEFLDDPRVVDLPWWIRKPLLYGAILPFRPKQSAKAYAAIWDPQKGSPLLYHMQALKQEVQKALGKNFVVEMGMRYGKPSIKQALESFKLAKCQRIIVLPLFPQYSSAATGSAIQHFLETFKNQLKFPTLNIQQAFYNDEGYIQAQAALIQSTLEEAKADHILLSYHSLPTRQIRKSADCQATCDNPCKEINADNEACYRAQCFETARLVAKNLGLAPDQLSVAFQSRLGKTQWIGPDLPSALQKLREQGVKHLAIASPSFVVDCLETLEELGIRAKQMWHALGGESFTLVPCLNVSPLWVKTVVDFVHHKATNCTS